MFLAPIFQPLKKIVYSTLNPIEIDKIDITTLIEQYILRYFSESLLKDDAFLLLAISVIMKKRMKKLRQQLMEAQSILFNNNQQTKIQVKTHIKKIQKQRREEIIVDNKLIKLPHYFEQNQNSQLANEASISLPISQQNSQHSQQLLEMEQEKPPEQIFVQDYREIFKNQYEMKQLINQQIFSEEKQINQKLQLFENAYQQMIDKLHISFETPDKENDECETKKNTRRKIKIQMDQGIKKSDTSNYKSQFYEMEQEDSKLSEKLEQYLISEYKQFQKEFLFKKDDLLQQIYLMLDDSQFQNQLMSVIMVQDEKYLNQSCESLKSNISIKSIMKSKAHSEDSLKSVKNIQFIEEQLEMIQEEQSNHYNTSISLFQDKSSFDKAVQFYHTLCDASTLTNKILDLLMLVINDIKYMSQQFYYDIFKIISQLSLHQNITPIEKDTIKSIIINTNSNLFINLQAIYTSEEFDNVDKLIIEIKKFVKSIRLKKPKFLKNKQMRIITEDCEEQQLNKGDVIYEEQSDCESIE